MKKLGLDDGSAGGVWHHAVDYKTWMGGITWTEFSLTDLAGTFSVLYPCYDFW
jgi:hypothetical protein